MTPPAPVTLEGERVRLVPLLPEHAPALWDVAQDAHIWTYMPVRISSLSDMETFIANALRSQEQGLEVPFAVWDKTDNRLVGSTRFLDIAPAHRGLEIGWTWYSPTVWRTGVNSECKLLLLTHCFEALDLIRVCLKTDLRNERSQRAIERLGAQREGVWRNHRILPDGVLRDSVYYSILPAEWPAVKLKLESALQFHAFRQSP